MKNHFKILILIYIFSFVRAISQPINIDFGIGNINGWNFEHGDNINSLTMTTGTLNASAEYSIMTSSGSEINNIPITMSSPLGGNFLRIGSPDIGGKTYKLSQTFYVDASSSALAFSSVFIVQEGGHTCSDQPYFNLSIKDANGLIIPNSNTYISGPSSGCTSGDPNFIAYSGSGGVAWSYLSWQNRSFDLTNYIGTNVTIECLVSGCTVTQGAHPGYAYIDAALCTNNFSSNTLTINNNLYSLIQSSSTINLCNNYPFTIVAPFGATTYSWSGGNINGLSSQSVTVNQSGTYNLICDKASACSNSTSVTFNIDTMKLETSTSNSLICNGQSVTLTAIGASSYTWNNGAISQQIIETPTVTTNYTVTGTSIYGCLYSSVITQSVSVCTNINLLEHIESIIVISPNPTNGALTINSKTELQKVEVVAITGQILLSEVPTNVPHTLHLDNFANGIYFVNLYQNNRIVKREKVVLNK